MENQQINVMEEIQKFEQAQIDYQRQKTRENLSDSFRQHPDFVPEILRSNFREYLTEETPGGLPPMLSSVGSEIVNNTEIAEDELESRFWKAEETKVGDFRALLEGAQAAYVS